MPEQTYPPYVAGALTTPRELQRWLDINPQNGSLRRTEKYIVVPAFAIPVIWLGYSQIIGEYHFEATNNFSLKGYIPPVDPNYTLCVSYVNSDHTVVRYRLWSCSTDVIYGYIPQYTGQMIKKNFRLEVWSAPVGNCNQLDAITLYTSVRGNIDYRWGSDSVLVGNDGLCQGQAAHAVDAGEPALTDGVFWFNPTAGTTFTGDTLTSWIDQISEYELTGIAGYDNSSNLLTFAGTGQGLSTNGSLPANKDVQHFFMSFVSNVDGAYEMLLLFSSSYNLNLEHLAGSTIQLTTAAGILTYDVTNGVKYIFEFVINVTGTTWNIYSQEGNLLSSQTNLSDSILNDLYDIGISPGVGSYYEIGNMVSYSQVLSADDKAITMNYMISQLITVFALPLTWGACAQPVLNNTDNNTGAAGSGGVQFVIGVG